ncbi:hypothetical protein M707_27125, partial [Arthrobacter sp. AK-YN10]
MGEGADAVVESGDVAVDGAEPCGTGGVGSCPGSGGCCVGEGCGAGSGAVGAAGEAERVGAADKGDGPGSDGGVG